DLMLPQRFYVHGQSAQGDRHVYAGRSRFLPSGLVGHFESVAWPTATAAQPRSRFPQAAKVDLGARMRAMWR
ncbi:hypothetical protein J8J20_24245, partial [Mycobacterium tuberculosis]|nr:hypothetical protein [Mycobacterium tuberculosis]